MICNPHSAAERRQECSPRREPWEEHQKTLAPKRRGDRSLVAPRSLRYVTLLGLDALLTQNKGSAPSFSVRRIGALCHTCGGCCFPAFGTTPVCAADVVTTAHAQPELPATRDLFKTQPFSEPQQWQDACGRAQKPTRDNPAGPVFASGHEDRPEAKRIPLGHPRPIPKQQQISFHSPKAEGGHK